MTGKVKSNASNSSVNYERESLKYRNENKWQRMRDLASTIPINDKKLEIISKFWIAESILENFLSTNPTILRNQQTTEFYNSQQAKLSAENVLYESENLLKEVVAKSDLKSVRVEASILLIKLFYLQMRNEEAIKMLNSQLVKQVLNENLNKVKQTDWKQTPKTETVRQMQIYAEAHSLKGLFLEQKILMNEWSAATNPSIKFNVDEHRVEEQEMIDSFELASFFAIQHALTNRKSVSSSAQNVLASNSQNQSTQDVYLTTNASSINDLNNIDDIIEIINPFYEFSLQKAPLCYLRKGDVKKALSLFRDLLLKKTTQSTPQIRQIVLKKFADSLIFYIASNDYFSLTVSIEDKKLFKPSNQDEEILLCLLLAQYLTSRDVLLLRHDQFKNIREFTLSQAISSLDLMLIYLTYKRSLNVAIEKFEMAMKYSFQQFYVWYQYALTLINDKKFNKAYHVLKACIQIKPDHLASHLLLAKIALENLFLIDESIEWCEKVFEMTNSKNRNAFILYGCAMRIKAQLQKQHAVQLSFYEKALDAFKKATLLDPSDYLALYHLAHCYAIQRQINMAIETLQRAFKFKPDDKDCLHLLALLLTSSKNYEQAHVVISKAAALYDDIEILYTKIRIEEALFGFSTSVNSLVNLMSTFRKKHIITTDPANATSPSTVSGVQSNIKRVTKLNPNMDIWSTFDNASFLNLQQTFKLNDAIGKTVSMLVQNDQLSFKYESLPNMLNVENTLALVRILTQIGEFYLRHGKLKDAEQCCQEISSIQPMSYLTFYLKGRILEYREELTQAKICYQNALSINPDHIQTLQQMAVVVCQMGELHFAEKLIRDAIALNNGSPESWSILGTIMELQKDKQTALKCFQTSIQLESTNPILPFTSITRFL